MGYTHHWYQDGELDADKFKKASADCKKLCKGSSIQFEYDDNKLPIFTNEQIRFNGMVRMVMKYFLLREFISQVILKLIAAGGIIAFVKLLKNSMIGM